MRDPLPVHRPDSSLTFVANRNPNQEGADIRGGGGCPVVCLSVCLSVETVVVVCACRVVSCRRWERHSPLATADIPPRPTDCAHTPYTHTRARPLSGTTRVSRYQKDKTNLDFTEARDSEWQ